MGNTVSKNPPDKNDLYKSCFNAWALCDELARIQLRSHDDHMSIQQQSRDFESHISPQTYLAFQDICEEIVAVLRAENGGLFPSELLMVYARIVKTGRFASTPRETTDCLDRIHQYWLNVDALRTEFRRLQPERRMFLPFHEILRDDARAKKAIEQMQPWLVRKESKMALRNLGPLKKKDWYRLQRSCPGSPSLFPGPV